MALFLLAFIALAPIVVMLLTSLKSQVEIMGGGSILDFEPTLDNYIYVFDNKFGFYLWNSMIVTVASTVLSLFVSGLAAYALARLRFPGRNPIAYFTLIIRMVPPAVLAIPIFILWLNWELFLFDTIDASAILTGLPASTGIDPFAIADGLIDGRLGLTLFYTALNLPFAIWLLIGFLKQLPAEMEEAAIVDGASQWQVFTKIIFPLMRPGFAVAAIFTFRVSWNEFLLALVLTDRNTRTLPVGITLFLTEQGGAVGSYHGDGHADRHSAVAADVLLGTTDYCWYHRWCG